MGCVVGETLSRLLGVCVWLYLAGQFCCLFSQILYTPLRSHKICLLPCNLGFLSQLRVSQHSDTAPLAAASTHVTCAVVILALVADRRSIKKIKQSNAYVTVNKLKITSRVMTEHALSKVNQEADSYAKENIVGL